MKAVPFILASASPQRKRLLKSLNIPFRIVPSRVSEASREKRPRRLALQLAVRKARAVADRHPGALVLGADTIVVHRGRLILKPRDKADSARILKLLNGRWHRVYTGICLIDGTTRRAWREVVVSKVKARALPETHLARFVGKHMDKAGAYAVQDSQDPFIERIEGPFDNVVGLPVASVRRMLREALKSRSPGF